MNSGAKVIRTYGALKSTPPPPTSTLPRVQHFAATWCGLPGTGSGVRVRCACLGLCFVASWSDARQMHLELARSDSDASRLCLGCYSLGRLHPPAVFCQQQLMFFVSRRADARLES